MTSYDPSSTDPTAAYADLSRIALSDHPLDRAFEDMAGVARRVLPEATQVSVTLLTEDRPRTAAAIGQTALTLDERQYADNHGPCLDAARLGGPIQVAVDDPQGTYPGFQEAAERAGMTHSLSVGIPTAGRYPGAALNVYSDASGPFSGDSVRMAETLAAFAGYALAARVPDDAAAAVQLQDALASRTAVKQAQGVLMQQLHCSLDEAFTRLVELAQQQGQRLHEAARAVLDQQAGPAAG